MTVNPLRLVAVTADRLPLDLKALALVGNTDGALLVVSTGKCSEEKPVNPHDGEEEED
jgi:hypothetical protein